MIEGFPLAPRQRRLWDWRSNPELRTSAVLLLEGELAPGAVVGGLRRIVARHEILRTTFRALPGMPLPLQVIGEVPCFAYHEVDLDGVPAPEPLIDELSRVWERIAPDLERGPVARFLLASLGASRHLLVIDLPPLCADARSLDNLAAELAAECTGGPPAAGEEPVQFADFADWLASPEAEEQRSAGREFWLAQDVAGLVAELPPDRQPAGRAGGSWSAGWLERPLGPGLAGAAAALASRLETSCEAVLLTAWLAVVWRLRGGPGVALGHLDPGRRFQALGTAIGPYALAVPFACRFTGDTAFGELAQAIEESLRAADGQREWFDGAGGFPLFFGCEEREREHLAGGLRLTPARRWAACEPAQIELVCVRSGEDLMARFRFAPDRYTPERIGRLADSFAALLESAARGPEAAVADLDLLGEAETRLLSAWSGSTPLGLLPAGCLHERIAARAARQPDVVAVSGEGRALTYGELDRRSGHLSRRLRRLGVGPESRVVLLAERSPEALVGLLGVWKAGGAYVPLDPGQPRERLRWLLADAAAAVVLTMERLAAALPQSPARVLLLDAADEPIYEAEDGTAVEATGDNLAYVIYTSGSTGRPKGVMVPHRAVVNLAEALAASVYAGESGPLRISLNAPLAFDASVKQLAQLAGGHTLSIVPEAVRADGEALLDHLCREQVEVLDCTPSQLRLLLAAGLLAAGAAGPRRVLLGGEPIDAALWQELAAAARPAFYNVYGPTECTVDATACRVEPLAAEGVPVLGSPLRNVRVYLLDGGSRQVPIGVAGEIAIGGAGVARGYLERPDLSAERFQPDPWGAPGSRLYRTGDLARYLPNVLDGGLCFLGRADRQVKVRGLRVELGEIEAALLRHPEVAAAAVVERRDGEAGEPRLVAYVVRQARQRHLLSNGMAVFHQNRNETEYLYREIFERRSYLRYGLRLSPGATVFDVGANIGLFTLFAGCVSPGCRVFAFEPIPPLYETLRANAELYAGGEVRLFPFGLAETGRTDRFAYYPRYSMMSGLAAYADPRGEVEVVQRYLERSRAAGDPADELLAHADELLAGRFQSEVVTGTLRRLSEVLREHGVERIDLLKVDVQRAELDVLRGIDDADWPRIEQVVLEAHDAGEGGDGRLAEVLALLRGRGFHAVAEQDELLAGTDRHNVYATRRPLGPGAPAVPPPPPVTPSAGTAAGTAELRDFLARRLPEAMLPAAFVALDELPLTRNGKLDHAALPAPESVPDATAAEPLPPRGPVEEIVAGIWAEVLGVPRVGVDQSFFDLGGHSLLATRVIARLRAALAVELPIRALFEAPTVRGLAERATAARGGPLPLPPIKPAGRAAPLPLSFAQQRLWFLACLAPGSPLYNNPFALELRGDLDPAALAAALAGVVRRHEVLRTVFRLGAEGPVQVVLPPPPPRLPVVDLAALPGPARTAAADALAREEALRPFDLANGPLLRACLLRLGEAEHLALLTLHHIVCDGWSLGLLARELAALYGAARAGMGSPLPDLPVQYADFAVWQHRHLTDAALAADLAYWRSRLEGLPPLLPLPADRPRPATPSDRSGRYPFTVPAGLLAAQKALAREQGATLFIVLLAGLAALLSRWTGEVDFAIGAPIAGRDRLEVEKLIGFFVNPLVLRLVLAGDPSFTELLARTRQMVLEAHAHQAVPFERLIEEHAPVRTPDAAQLFQVLLVLHNEPQEALVLPGLEVRGRARLAAPAKLDLGLTAEESDGELGAAWEYASDLFDPPTVARLASHWQTLLAAAVATPGLRLSELPLLSAAERHQLLLEHDAAAVAVAATLPELLHAQAARTPEVVALRSGHGDLTYRQLDLRAGRLARHLRSSGVGPEVRVGLCLPRSPDAIVALLATLKAGGAYVPLDPAYPAERLAWMLADAAVPVLVTDSRLAGELPVGRAWVIAIDELPELPEDDMDGPPPLPAGLACVIYTSGSSGWPKGVEVTQGALCNLACAQARAFGIGIGSRVLQFASLSFDAAAAEILATLCAGGTLVLSPAETLLAGSGLLAALSNEDVTHVTLPPSVLALLPEAELPALAVLIAAGEPCSEELAARWGAGRRFLNAYGPTEGTVCATVEEWAAGRPGGLSIGRPLPGVRIDLRDDALRLVPAGVTGELCLGGGGVTRGYADRPALTAERFVPDPEAEVRGEPGARLYRTGDLGRRRADGRLELLGRRDRQVKVRGFRVEPGEVEAALLRHPGVREAAVLAGFDHAGGRRLEAFYVAEPEPADVRDFLRRSLPDHLVPSTLVQLAALPLTPHGKIDRAALARSAETAAAVPGAAEGPLTPFEQVVAAVWEEVLGREGVGASDDFFALGGHSLLAVQVSSRLAAVLGVELPLRTLFAAPTLAAYAREVAAATRGALVAEGSPEPPVVPAGRQAELPLSFAQQRLWFLAQLDPGSPSYHLPAAVRLEGALDRAALAAALAEVVRRHEALRTRFPVRDGRARQEIVPAAALPLPLADLSGLGEADRAAALQRLAVEWAVRPFDLARGPVLRLALLRLDRELHVALFNLHHIAADAWSLAIFLREVGELYTAHAARRPAALPPLPVQYADYAVWQRRWLVGEILEERLRFFRRQLAGAPRQLDLPLDRPRPAVPDDRGRHLPVRLPPSVAAGIRAVARGGAATPFMVLLAVFQALLGRLAGQDDVCVGTPVAGRERREIEGLVGCFVNTLVLRADLSGRPGLTGLLGRVRAACLGAYLHQDLPFERLVDALDLDRDGQASPLFQVMFALDDVPLPVLALGGLSATPLPVESGRAKFDLVLSLGDDGGAFAGALAYRTGLFDPATVRRLVAQLETLAEAAAGAPDRSLAALPLLAPAERHQLVHEWNDAATARPVACLHELVAEQAARTPDRVALDAAAGQMSYRTLDSTASRLAGRLRQAGVGPERVVGLLAERSPALIVGLLAILKAGGSWLPLDPSHPGERLAALLADAGAVALLAEPRLAASLPPHPARLLELSAGPATDLSRAWPAATPALPESLAYALYTSGSTGRPKGVLVSHRAIANRLLWVRDLLRLDAEASVLQKTPASFDASIWEVFLPLLCGARLVLAPEGSHRDPAALVRLVVERQVAVLQLVPSLLGPFLDAARGISGIPLRHLFCGGEVLAPVLRDRAHTALTAELWNLYGPTECAIDALCWPCRRDDVGPAVPLGRPLANVRVHLLDALLEPVPIGVAGEIFIGGAGLARGYAGRPETTAAVFVPDPWASEPGARLYRTGDLARRLPDGTVLFLRRTDDQIKLRGHRIEPQEIEAALLAEPGVVEAAVAVREVAPGDRRLVAYVVPRDGATLATLGTLRSALARRLPEPLIPALWVFLEALPRTSGGKLDRAALPSPHGRAAEPAEAFVPPHGPIEETLAAIWSAVLGREQVGIHDNFFHLGGDSILSIQIVARAHQAGLQLAPRQLFLHPTIAELAAVAGRAGAIDAEQGEVTGDVPLTPIQRRFFSELPADPHHFSQSLLLAAATLPDPSRLEEALALILRRHDALRLRFVHTSAAWRQLHASPGGAVPFCRLDLGALPPPARTAALTAAAVQAETGFDLTAGPLLRAVLVDCGAAAPWRARLLLTAHHLVVDAVSWRILLAELESLYGQLAAGAEVHLAAKTTSFRRWAERLVELARSPEVESELGYWLSLPRGGEAVLAPSAAGAGTVGSTRTIETVLDRENTRALLEELPAAARAEVPEALLAALVLAFRRVTGRGAVWLDLEGHGREQDLFPDVDLSATVGWFTTLYPVRLDTGPGGEPQEVLAHVKEQLRAIPGRGLGFGLLRYLGDAATAERLATLPRPQVLFNYLGRLDGVLAGSSGWRPAEEPTGPGRSPRAARAHPLEIAAWVADGRLRIVWGYSATMPVAAMVERLAAELSATLAQLIADCREPGAALSVADFPLAVLDRGGLADVLREVGLDEV